MGNHTKGSDRGRRVKFGNQRRRRRAKVPNFKRGVKRSSEKKFRIGTESASGNPGRVGGSERGEGKGLTRSPDTNIARK